MALTRDAIEEALTMLAQRALADGLVVEIAIYGGAAMALAFAAREATRVVDAVARVGVEPVRRYVRAIALEKGWPQDWLNDAVKGFVSPLDQAATALGRSFPDEVAPGLRVYFPTAEYMLAMKLLAMRIDTGDGAQDLSDIKTLIGITGIGSADALADLVAGFYPDRQIPPRTAFGIAQLADEIARAGRP